MKSLFTVLPEFPKEYQYDIFSQVHFFDNIRAAYENLKSITSEILMRDADRKNWIHAAIQNLNDEDLATVNQYELEWYDFQHTAEDKNELIRNFKKAVMAKVIDHNGNVIKQDSDYIHIIYFKASNNHFLSQYSINVKHQDLCNFIVKGM